jgi:hypothetical protein
LGNTERLGHGAVGNVTSITGRAGQAIALTYAATINGDTIQVASGTYQETNWNVSSGWVTLCPAGRVSIEQPETVEGSVRIVVSREPGRKAKA